MPCKTREPGEPLHLDSLGPCPTTVAEWVKQCERTGILEFPLLLAIADQTEQHANEAAASLRAALDWSIKTDNQIIIDHVRAALIELEPLPSTPEEAVNHPDGHIRCKAIKYLNDQKLIAKLAAKDPCQTVQLTAVEHLRDQKILSRFAMFHPDASVRQIAVNRLNEAGANVVLPQGGEIATETQAALDKLKKPR